MSSSPFEQQRSFFEPTAVNSAALLDLPLAGAASTSSLWVTTGTGPALTIVDDYAADLTTTGVVAVNGSSSGQIETSGDQDWFRVDLIAGRIYAFDMKGVDSASGTLPYSYLQLLTGTSAYVAADIGSGLGNDARLIFSPGSQGAYFLSAQSSYGYVGSYTLEATELGADDYPGNAGTTATLAMNAAVSGDIQFYGDQDWFRMELSAGQIYAFDLKGAASGNGSLSAPIIRLVNAAVSAVTATYYSGTEADAHLVYSPLSGGTWYLSAEAFYNATGSYTLVASNLGSDDYLGNTDTTGTLTVGGTVTGNIQFSTDQDWFRVELTAGRIYAIDLKGADSAAGTLLDPRLDLLDSATNYLAYDNDSGTGSDARLTYSPPIDGEFYLAAGLASGAAGTYTLALVDIGADDYIGSTATTGALAVGASASGNIQFTGDQDWFRIELTAGRIYAFEMRGVDSAGGTLTDPFLLLRSSAGDYLASNFGDGVGADAYMSLSLAESGTYYLTALALGSRGTYTVQASDQGADDYAGGISTSGRLAMGGTASGTIQFNSDQDWFRVELSAGHFYVFDLKGIDSGGGTLPEPMLQLYDAASGYLATDFDSGVGADARLSFNASRDGSYFLAAIGSGGAGTFTLMATDLGADDYDGSIATTGSLALGGSSTGAIQMPGETDWFRIELRADRIYAFDLKGADSGGGTLVDPYLQLRDSAGNVVFTDDDSGTGLDARLTSAVTTDGTYFLSVQGLSENGTGSYTLTAADLGRDDYADSSRTTGTLAAGDAITGNIQFTNDQDWFRVDLNAGTTYIFKLQGAESGMGTLATPILQLYSGTGLYLDSGYGYGGNDVLLTCTPAGSGTFYLAAQTGYGSPGGTYTLSAGLDDHAGSTLTSGTIAAGETAVGTIQFAGDQDWFRIDLSAGTEYVFDLTTTGVADGPGTYLVLFNSTGNYLTSDESHLFLTPTSSGVHYLAAQGYSPGSSFSLSVGFDDYANGITTTGNLTPGETLSGVLQNGSDTDWIKISLTAGSSYTFTLEGRDSGGGTLQDPLLRLRNSSGNEIALNQDGGIGRDAHLTYVAPDSGTYYLSVEAQSGYGGEGDTYTLTSRNLGNGYQATPVSNAIALTNTATVDGLTQGSAWQFSGARVLTYSFNDVIDEGVTLLGGAWSDTQKEAIREALHAWETVADLSFVEIAGSATIETNTAHLAFGHVGDFIYPAVGMGIFPSPIIADQFLQEIDYSRAEYPRLEGDVLLDDYAYEMQYLAPGDSGFWVGLHEIGHALGLKHPFDDGGNGRPTFIDLGIGAMDISVQTTMSYDTPESGLTGGYQATPMLLDIAAIQRIYGANSSYHNTDNTYFLSDGGILRTLWDTGGNDWLDATQTGTSVVLSLEAGSINRYGYQGSVIAIASGVSIENVRGSAGSDTLTGTAAANILDGGSGADTLAGGPGNDTYWIDSSGDVVTELFNAGNDSIQSTISYSLGNHLENLTLLGSNPLSGTGNALDNIITGNNGSNLLTGGGGSNTLIGGLGNDTYVVDTNSNTLIERANQGTDSVQANLSWTLGANLENLTLLGDRQYSATGNALGNTLTGNAAANILDGGCGADTLIGGAGNDIYVTDNAGDVIQETGADAGDSVRSWVDWALGDNLENLALLGTKPLNGTGNALNNSLTGNGGANILNGGDGNDLLNGASGNDTLTGGSGADTFAFTTPLNALRNVDTITDFVSGIDKFELASAIFRDIGFTGSPDSDAFFRSASAAQDADDRVVYDQSTGMLAYDADGSGAMAAVQFAVLGGAPLIQYTDFVMV